MKGLVDTAVHMKRREVFISRGGEGRWGKWRRWRYVQSRVASDGDGSRPLRDSVVFADSFSGGSSEGSRHF